jgi:Flp pilus assembly protein TadD
MAKLTQAVASLKKAIELDPNDPDTHYFLGEALKKSGDYEDAIKRIPYVS